MRRVEHQEIETFGLPDEQLGGASKQMVEASGDLRAVERGADRRIARNERSDGDVVRGQRAGSAPATSARPPVFTSG